MVGLGGTRSIIAGAAQGIGAILTRGLAADGAGMFATDINDVQSTVDAIRGAGGTAEGMRVDVTWSEDLTAMAITAEWVHVPFEIRFRSTGIFADLALGCPMTDIDGHQVPHGLKKCSGRALYGCRCSISETRSRVPAQQHWTGLVAPLPFAHITSQQTTRDRQG